MQRKSTFTKCFTFSTPQRKCPILRQKSQKWPSLAATARYITIVYTIGSLQIFKAWAILSKEALSWSLRKPKMMTLFYLARLVSDTWAANVWNLIKSRKRLGTNSENKIKPCRLRAISLHGRIPTSHIVVYCVKSSLHNRSLIKPGVNDRGPPQRFQYGPRKHSEKITRSDISSKLNPVFFYFH